MHALRQRAYGALVSTVPGSTRGTGEAPPLRRTVAAGILIGAANALGLLGFEWLVDQLQELIWIDWAGSNETRWLVLPLAIAGSVALSLTVRATRQTRMMPPHTDVLAEVDQIKPGTLRMIAVLLVTGVVSLVGGASLGPEGAVIPASIAFGAWVAGRGRTSGPVTELLVLSSIGALLVSFFGSLLPAPIPLLIMRRQGKPLTRRSAIPPLLAGATAWAIVSVIRGGEQGRDFLPIDSGGGLEAVVPALVLGMLAVLVGVLLRLIIRTMHRWTERIDRLWHWIAAAALFGAVLGALYWIGGESVQFSGKEGTHQLYDERAHYGAAALAGLLLVKLLATGWSISAGYRGGVAFPSVYAGVALSLAVTAALPGVSESGAMIGAIAGILAEMTTPAVAFIMLLSMMPTNLLPLGLVGAIGAVVGRRALERVMPRFALKPSH
jgi:H+/Cl- antiporter ClcA